MKGCYQQNHMTYWLHSKWNRILQYMWDHVTNTKNGSPSTSVRSSGLRWWVPFSIEKFRGCRFEHFSVARSRNLKEWYPLILMYILTIFGGCNLFESCTIKIFVLCNHKIRSRGIYEWYCLTLICVPNKSGDCSFHKSCDMFLICHLTTYSQAVSLFGRALYHRSHQFWFPYLFWNYGMII